MEPTRVIDPATDPSSPAQRSRRTFVWVGLALVVLGALGGWVWVRSLKSSGPPPLAQMVFPDGFAVQILRAELTDRLAFEVPPSDLVGKLRSAAGPVLNLKSVKENGFLPWTLATQISNGSFAGGHIRHEQYGPALVLLFRATDSGGQPFSTDVCLFDQQRKVIQRERGRFADVRTVTADEQPSLPLELFFEVEDGAGGWLLLDGPVILDAADGHGFAMRFVFPRRSPVLRCRVGHAGSEPVEFEVPNPGYRSTFPLHAAEKLPAVRRCSDFAATLHGLIRMGGGAVTGHVQWDDLVAPDTTFQKIVSVYDETGSLYGSFPGWRNYATLPNEKMLRVRCWLDRYPEDYPFQLADVTVLAVGTIPVGGGRPTASLTKEGLALGYKAISFETVPAGKIFQRTGKPTMLIFELKAAPDRAQFKKLESDYDTERAVVFTDGSRSTGYTYKRVGSTFNISTLANGYSTQHEWAGDLKAGESFKIALLKKLPPAEVEFFVNRR